MDTSSLRQMVREDEELPSVKGALLWDGQYHGICFRPPNQDEKKADEVFKKPKEVSG